MLAGISLRWFWRLALAKRQRGGNKVTTVRCVTKGVKIAKFCLASVQLAKTYFFTDKLGMNCVLIR